MYVLSVCVCVRVCRGSVMLVMVWGLMLWSCVVVWRCTSGRRRERRESSRSQMDLSRRKQSSPTVCEDHCSCYRSSHHHGIFLTSTILSLIFHVAVLAVEEVCEGWGCPPFLSSSSSIQRPWDFPPHLIYPLIADCVVYFNFPAHAMASTGPLSCKT